MSIVPVANLLLGEVFKATSFFSAIGEILRSLPCRAIDTDYLSILSVWVDQALINNLSVVSDLEQAHQWLRRITDCLHYPKYSKTCKEDVTDITDTNNSLLTSFQVRREMEELLEQFRPDPQHHPAQLALKKKLQRLWHKYGTNLLYCYDIPGLPPDNLKMEAMFSHFLKAFTVR